MITILKKSLKFTALLLTVLAAVQLSSCRKDDVDEPPINGVDPNLKANISIADLKNLWTGSIFKVDSNLIIAGIVTADDKSGNFYKTIVLEDSSGGISIRLDETNYNVEFPIGRRVFVKLNGLYVGDYGGLVQIGGWVDSSDFPTFPPSVEPIAYALVRDHLIGGEYNLNPQPMDININQINPNDLYWQNRFIELDSAEFAEGDTAKTFADAITLDYGQYDITQCKTSGKILLRTSGYSNFASKPLPNGKGKIKGIVTVYNGTLQLIIRDERDVNMEDDRCNTVTGTPTLVPISTIRGLFTGGSMTITNNYFIEGVVTSDRTTSNLNGQNLFIQDASGGICVRFAKNGTQNHTFNLGDSLRIDFAGQNMAEFNGLLQIGSNTNVPQSKATILGSGKTVTPQVVTIGQILANMAGNDSWEGSLVQIQNATISSSTGSTTYSGSIQVNDATGTMTIYTTSAASFASTAFPNGTVSVTAILSDYSGNVTPPNTNAQLLLRNTTDVQ